MSAFEKTIRTDSPDVVKTNATIQDDQDEVSLDINQQPSFSKTFSA